MHGIPQNVLDKIKITIFALSTVEEAIIYGSRAKGNYKEGSDIDIVIKGDLSFNDLTKISVNLEELNLPWKIDISLYNQIKNFELLEHIERVGITI